MIRIETILDYVRKDEAFNSCISSSEASFRDYSTNYKDEGESTYIEYVGDGDYITIGRGGRRRRRSAAYIREKFPTYRINENAVVDYDDEPPSNVVIELPAEKPVHCNKTPSVASEANNYVQKSIEELAKLGYDPEVFEYPEITPDLEVLSLQNHIKLFGDRLKTVVKPPTREEIERCVNLIVALTPNNKFFPDVGYKSLDNIVEIIDSSLVQDTKSPGHPYQSDGLATNQQVLKKYGKKQFAELVLQLWDEPIQNKWFLKVEPAKRKKLSADMPRGVTGFPLHFMVKSQCIMKNSLAANVENWYQSPIKYAFVPNKPGHIKNLERVFGDRPVWESDKSNWDFNMYQYFFEICKRVNLEWALKPLEMSDEEFENWKNDFEHLADAFATSNDYRCTNGRVFRVVPAGIMKSGLLSTIAWNTISQIACDVLVKMRMGLSDADILNPINAMIAGGDDALQTFDDSIDVTEYVNQAKLLGVEMEFKKNSSLNGAEYFSTKLVKQDGVWKYYPVRFTKHIEKLRRTSLVDLPGALACHMINYCWDKRKYNFFYNMFMTLRKEQPSIFLTSFCKTRRELQYKALGHE